MPRRCARAYDDNERLLARALRSCGAEARARIVTKGGMARPGGAWVPDGRAKAILADCEASLAALDGLPIDLYLIHARDPRTPWRTSVRALARLADEGLVRRVGLSNVNRRQLDEALELAPVAAVQVALNPFDDTALRGGVVERCAEKGIAVIAHSPLGGPRRAGGLAVARASPTSPARRARRRPRSLSPGCSISPLRWSRSPALDARRRPAPLRAQGRSQLTERGSSRSRQRSSGSVKPGTTRWRGRGRGHGHPGSREEPRSRKSTSPAATSGSIATSEEVPCGELAGALDEALSSGTGRVVLDNTYLTRAARNDVIETARRHGSSARCIWLDTPLAQAQVNLVQRLLDRFGSLPTTGELRALARLEPGLLAPTSQMRALRELEPPSPDEGFVEVEQVSFERAPATGRTGVMVAAAALSSSAWERAIEEGDPKAPHLVFDWSPEGSSTALEAGVARLARAVSGSVDSALCPHGAGPPICWCRPPLPGLPLAFARAREIDLSRSVLVGSSPVHRTLATTLGARYVSRTSTSRTSASTARARPS